MNVDEYLKTSFDGPDCEYLDGEVVERNMGELPHAMRKQPRPRCYVNSGAAWAFA